MVLYCHLDIQECDIEHLFFGELSYNFNSEEKIIVKEEIDTFLDLGVLVMTETLGPGYFSYFFFFQTKKDGFKLKRA